jgi:4-aminobutyrate aminotransferase-like enzyme/maleate cis-trans isomerase
MQRGDLGRIGFLWPGDGLNDDEYWRYLPDGVAWLTQRYPGTLPDQPLNRATFEASAGLEHMVAAARVLAEAHPDVVAIGDHAGSFIMGPGHDLTQVRAVALACGAPVGTTPSTAIVAAMAHLGVTRLAVASPYDEAVTAAGVDFLRASGVDVVACHQAGFDDELAIAGTVAEVWADMARQADRAGAQAILLMGGGLRLGGLIPRLEAELGKPVLTAPAALVWHACRLLREGQDQGHYRPALGRLFGHPPDDGEMRNTLARHLSSGTKTLSISPDPPIFAWGAGTELFDTKGRVYLDFACGSGTSILGHAHPVILRALADQAATGIMHLGPHFQSPVQMALIKRLAGLLPPALSVLHPATNGTEATEVAIKAVVHATGRNRFIGFAGSYHGRSLGALAISHERGANSSLALPPEIVTHLDWPAPDADLAPLEQALTRALELGDVAAIIAEPVQATAGMRVPPPGFLRLLRRVADQYATPLILDEVFTGYGKTGYLFAFQGADIVPDLVIMAKAAGGGMPGAMLAGTPALLHGWGAGAQSSTFQMHPFAAATSLAMLDVLEQDGLPARALHIEAAMRAAFAPLGPLVGTGAMLGLPVLDAKGAADQPQTRQIRNCALQAGLITWECGRGGHVIGLVPPLTVTDAQIERAAAILIRAVRPSR